MNELKHSTIAVLIPTMNRPESLERTLGTYFNAQRVPNQVIVVDQSKDKEIRDKNEGCLKRYVNKAECIYLFQETPSLTMARNTALKACSSDIVVFSDDDVDVNEKTLMNVESIMSDANIAMLGGVNFFDDLDRKPSAKKVLRAIGSSLIGRRNIFKLKKGHVVPSMLGVFPMQVKEKTPTEWAMGFFFVVRKKLVDKWHLQFDEKLTSYAYAEDLDFSYSYFKLAKKEGMSCFMSKRLIVKHLGSQEYRIPSKKQIYMYFINGAYLEYKHGKNAFWLLSMKWSNFCTCLMTRFTKRINIVCTKALKIV